MQWTAGAARKRGWICFSIVGAGGIAGLMAGSDPSAAQTKELTPAQVVAHRFPPAWNNVTPTLVPPVTTAIKQQIPSLFDPNPTYALAAADSHPTGLPQGALAYADPRVQAMATETPSTAPAAAETAPTPERRPAPRPAQSNDLFNDAQLASIKHRLRLTPDQEYYWPQVAAALRAISYRVGRTEAGSKNRLATIDPNSAEVQRLKSAAIPLIMTMREDQKREVRALARLMGLEAVASQI
jgi:hypothetical protein